MLPRRCRAVVLVAMLWPAAATRPDQGEAPAITGRVVDAQDGSALPGVSLRLGRQGSPELEIIWRRTSGGSTRSAIWPRPTTT